MAYLRFSRDRRGYETTALVHWSRARGGRDITRVLYWFRTPPHVKVGRAALDEEAIRGIEAANPDISFDWSRILEARPPETPVDDSRQPRPRGRRAETRAARGSMSAAAREAERDARVPRPDLPDVPLSWAMAQASPPPPEQDVSSAYPIEASGEAVELPDYLEGRVEQESPDAPASAGERVLGPDVLNRLKGRYAELLARISTRLTDQATADQLRARAAVLDPDSWVTDEEVRKAVANFEVEAQGLLAVLGSHRRRTRRGGRRHRRRAIESPPEAALTDAASLPPTPDLGAEGPDDADEPEE